MKKNLTRFLAAALMAAMVFSLAACGETDAESKEASSAASTTDVADETSSKEAADSSSDEAEPSSKEEAPASSKKPTKSSAPAEMPSGKFATVEEFAKSTAIQNELAALEESVKALGMNIAITGKGNQLIYTYTFITAVDATVADSLKTALDGQAATFEMVATSLKSAVEVKNPEVVVRYLNPDGTELCSGTFKAK